MMKRFVVTILVGAVIGGASYFTYARYLVAEPVTSMEAAAECNTCAMRHKAQLRTRLALKNLKESGE